jgi:hypothetical protein
VIVPQVPAYNQLSVLHIAIMLFSNCRSSIVGEELSDVRVMSFWPLVSTKYLLSPILVYATVARRMPNSLGGR